MRLTLRQLQVFVAIADHGSTTAAGEYRALAVGQQRRLQELEAHFGTPLFDRIGRRLALNGTAAHCWSRRAPCWSMPLIWSGSWPPAETRRRGTAAVGTGRQYHHRQLPAAAAHR